MLGPWAVPDGTNANGTRARSTRGLDNEANMVATSSAQVESLQVGPVSDRAGDVCTPPLGIPLKAGEAVRRTEAGIPPGPPEKAASTQEGKVPFGQATSSRARASEESKVRRDLQREGHQLRNARKIIRLPSSASKVVGSPQKGRAPKTDLESRAVGSLEARIGERVRRRTPVKEKRTLQEQSGILEIQVKKEQEDQEKRLLAQLESLCLDAGRRNSQHEQQHEQIA